MEVRYDFAIRGLHKVVDGDTVDLVVDVGFRTLLTQRVRLYLVNAPERGLPGANEAYLFLLDWLIARTGRLRLATYKEESFGRWVADIYVPSDGETVSEAMLRAGVAALWERKR